MLVVRLSGAIVPPYASPSGYILTFGHDQSAGTSRPCFKKCFTITQREGQQCLGIIKGNFHPIASDIDSEGQETRKRHLRLAASLSRPLSLMMFMSVMGPAASLRADQFVRFRNSQSSPRHDKASRSHWQSGTSHAGSPAAVSATDRWKSSHSSDPLATTDECLVHVSPSMH
jgi:hypothetical protein